MKSRCNYVVHIFSDILKTKTVMGLFVAVDHVRQIVSGDPFFSPQYFFDRLLNLRTRFRHSDFRHDSNPFNVKLKCLVSVQILLDFPCFKASVWKEVVHRCQALSFRFREFASVRRKNVGEPRLVSDGNNYRCPQFGTQLSKVIEKLEIFLCEWQGKGLI